SIMAGGYYVRRVPRFKSSSILDNGAVSPMFITARAMDRSLDLQSLFDCIYQVYDLEGIPYQRTVFTLDQNPIDDSNGIDF
ncbi:hypothetical protein, partial [Klebsiella pneumoniae]|uniref:hypothetical protein n=1 Tax=Klebsiella pneumoniae TaxID=573 RepID=UPI000BCC49D9